MLEIAEKQSQCKSRDSADIPVSTQEMVEIAILEMIRLIPSWDLAAKDKVAEAGFRAIGVRTGGGARHDA